MDEEEDGENQVVPWSDMVSSALRGASSSSIDEEISSGLLGVDGLLKRMRENNADRDSDLIAEVIGTYFVIFAGCGSVAVNKIYGQVTFPGVCVTWGLIVMVMIYSVGHISGAHFNPAVTITFAIFRQLPLWEVPMYIVAQLMGSILASGTLALVLDVTPNAYFGTVPVGSNGQSLVIEIVISFLLMFVISGATTDDRAVGELGGIAVGMTILLNVFVGGPISGASMNPARSIGPAVVKHVYKGLWVYIIGPIIGTIAGGLAYQLIRSKKKPPAELPNKSLFK